MWKLNNTVLSNTLFREVSREILKYFEQNKEAYSLSSVECSESSAWKGTCTLNTSIRKARSKTSALSFHPRKLGKKEHLNPK